jgi:FHS family L-fucose permease-like MFS transporter
VVPTYVGLGGAVLLLAFALSRAQFPAALGGHSQEESRPGVYGRLLRSKGLMLAVLAQFSYVGAQVSTWSSLIPYMRQYTAHSEREAGFFLAGNLVALSVGRVLSTWLMRWIRPVPMMTVYAIVNCSLLVLAIVHPGMAGAVAILITSFFMSMMFPTIFALGVEGLGADTKSAGGFLVMATGLGGATFPPLMGWIARATGSIAASYVLPAAAYVMVLVYALAARRLSPSVPEVEIVPQNV